MPDLHSLETLIRCRDIETSRKFYISVMGLTVVEQWEQSDGTGCGLVPSATSRMMCDRRPETGVVGAERT